MKWMLYDSSMDDPDLDEGKQIVSNKMYQQNFFFLTIFFTGKCMCCYTMLREMAATFGKRLWNQGHRL